MEQCNIDSDYYLIGTDDQGNKICYQETGRNGEETVFRQTIDPDIHRLQRNLPGSKHQSHYNYMK